MGRRFLLPILALLGLFAVLAVTQPVYRDMGWVDAVTGSHKYQTFWIFGLHSTPVIEATALEQWVRDREGSYQHDWWHIRGTWKTALGQSVGSGHGSAPVIMSMPPDMVDTYVQISSDPEIASFVDTLRRGTEAEQEKAVRGALDRVFEAWEADPSPIPSGCP